MQKSTENPHSKRQLPIFDWLIHYRRDDLLGDIIAGLTVAVMLVPQSLAYALLAGLPPIVGLYASIVPVMIYGLLGSARVLTLGPTAITSVMTLGTIGALSANNGISLTTLALTLALFLGIVYVLMGILRLGFIVNLLSRPVLVGYVNAAAIIIAMSQLQYLLGVSIERTSFPHMILWRTLQNLQQTNLWTVIIGFGGISLLLFFRYGLDALLKRFSAPQLLRFAITRSGALVLVIISISLSYWLNLESVYDVAVIGNIPAGFPSLTFGFDFTHWQALLLGAIAIAFVGFMEDISTAKSLMTGREQKLSPNQELMAMGVANIGAALTGGMPVTTSISRSAVNHAVGAKTGLSSIIAGAMLALTVIYLTPLFYYLPRATLAAIIITTVFNLIDIQTMRELWRYSRSETGVMLVTMLSVFLFSIEIGILLGIILSISLYVYRTSRTPIVELGRDGYSDFYTNIELEQAIPIPNVLILRIDESLYFANSQYLDGYLRNILSEHQDIDYLILGCGAVNTLDTSSIQILEELVKDFHELGIEVLISELRSRAFSRMNSGELRDLIGRDRFFATTHEAVIATRQLFDDDLPI